VGVWVNFEWANTWEIFRGYLDTSLLKRMEEFGVAGDEYGICP
jgi:hypothetical protein